MTVVFSFLPTWVKRNYKVNPLILLRIFERTQRTWWQIIIFLKCISMNFYTMKISFMWHKSCCVFLRWQGKLEDILQNEPLNGLGYLAGFVDFHYIVKLLVYSTSTFTKIWFLTPGHLDLLIIYVYILAYMHFENQVSYWSSVLIITTFLTLNLIGWISYTPILLTNQHLCLMELMYYLDEVFL